MDTKKILRISRPRFWHYLLGPYVLGVVYSGMTTVEMLFWIVPWGIWFLFCGNIIIYGVNDIADFDTDQYNTKKQTHEELVRPQYHAVLWKWIVCSIMIGAALIMILPSDLRILGGIIFTAFLFFGMGYSLPPIRAKARPFFDSVFNILYLFPGLFSFMLLTGQFPSWNILIGGLYWVMGMHVYSAVPDITSDRKAGLSTTATVLGDKVTLYWCVLLYTCSALLVMLSSMLLGVVMLIYPLIMIATITFPQRIHTLYWAFPWVNAVVGFVMVVTGITTVVL